MKQVYVDVLFLINFSLDYMSLYLCGRLFHYRMKRYKLLLLSILLSLYGIWGLLFCYSYLLLIITFIMSSVLACAIAYGIKHIKRLVTTAMVFSGIGGMLGCAIHLLYRLLSVLVPHAKDSTDNGTKIIIFTCLSAISGILIYIGNRIISDVRGERSVKITVKLQGRAQTMSMLVDSGNRVVDPLSGRHVIFMSKKCANQLMNNRIDDIDFMAKKRRWISIRTVGGSRVVPAFIPDEICINKASVDALIASIDQGDFHGFDGLFPSALLP